MKSAQNGCGAQCNGANGGGASPIKLTISGIPLNPNHWWLRI